MRGRAEPEAEGAAAAGAAAGPAAEGKVNEAGGASGKNAAKGFSATGGSWTWPRWSGTASRKGAQGRGGVAKPVGNRVIKKAHQDGGGEAVEGVVVGGGGRAVDRRCDHGGPEVVMEGGMPDQAQGGDKLTRRTEEGGDDAKHCAKGIVELNERRGRRREARTEGVGVGEEGHDGGKGRSVQEGGSGGVAALGGEVEEATTVVHPVGEGRPIAEDARVEGVGQAGVHDGRKGGPGAKGEDERPGRLTDGQADALGFVGRTDHPGAGPAGVRRD